MAWSPLVFRVAEGSFFKMPLEHPPVISPFWGAFSITLLGQHWVWKGVQGWVGLGWRPLGRVLAVDKSREGSSWIGIGLVLC